MKVIRNKIIPFRGFQCINLFGILFVRGNASLSARTMNHERIHTAQMKELLYVPFYLIYFCEWVVRFFGLWNAHKAYRAISFEVEARLYESIDSYLTTRKHYAQWRTV